ncbi:hypothetical protein HMPREF9062_0052 [Actinomyces sp. oral taxon 448 str. F0400]|nr:hypothetical protein HMPREF9062_0052 [Actinomyces sp. oral taxon 448 str. F0400]
MDTTPPPYGAERSMSGRFAGRYDLIPSPSCSSLLGVDFFVRG